MLADRYPRQRILLGIYVVRALVLAAMAAALGGGELARARLRARGAGGGRRARRFVRRRSRSCPCWRARRASSSQRTSPRARWRGSGRWSARRSAASWPRRQGSRSPSPRRPPSTPACALLVGRIRREGDVAGARRRVERSLSHELLGGVRTLAHEPDPRLIVLLFNSQTMVRGLLNVLLVVAAIELLGMGESGFGWLNAALGAGALAGGLASRRPRRPSQACRHLRHRARALGRYPSLSSAPGRGPGGRSCASGSSASATRCSTSRASRCSSEPWTSTCSGGCSASSRSVSPWRWRSARCWARSSSSSWGSARRSS